MIEPIDRKPTLTNKETKILLVATNEPSIIDKILEQIKDIKIFGVGSDKDIFEKSNSKLK